MKIEVNKIMNPAFLLGTTFNIRIGIGNTIQVLYVKEYVIHKPRMHYLDVRKKRSQNEFEEDTDRELE